MGATSWQASSVGELGVETGIKIRHDSCAKMFNQILSEIAPVFTPEYQSLSLGLGM